VGSPEDFATAIAAIEYGWVKEFSTSPGALRLKELAGSSQLDVQSSNWIGALVNLGSKLDSGMLEECRRSLVTLGRRSDMVYVAPTSAVSRPDPEQMLEKILKAFYLKAESFLCELLTSALESVTAAVRTGQFVDNSFHIMVVADKRDRDVVGYSIAIEDNGIGMKLSELTALGDLVRGFSAASGLERLSEEPGEQQIAYSLALAARLAREVVVVSKSRIEAGAQCIWEVRGGIGGEAREDTELKYGVLEGAQKLCAICRTSSVAS